MKHKTTRKQRKETANKSYKSFYESQLGLSRRKSAIRQWVPPVKEKTEEKVENTQEVKEL